MLDMLQVGVITTTHGLKGEVKVFLTSDDPKRFDTLDEVILVEGARSRPLSIEHVKYFKGRPILKFKGLDRIEDVEHLRGCPLMVTRENALPLAEGEYFIGDLIGCTCYLEDGTELGKLVDVLQTGANDVYHVKTPGGRVVLIPVIPDVVRDIDLEKGEIRIFKMKGLFDE